MIHIEEGLDCPCQPRFFKLCDDCNDYANLQELIDEEEIDRCHMMAHDAADVPGCWKCVKGLIEITYAEAELIEDPILVVHNAEVPGPT